MIEELYIQYHKITNDFLDKCLSFPIIMKSNLLVSVIFESPHNKAKG